jgi:TRAP-type mannitol/chloroaromatic compound transport system permease small subunit
LLWEIGVLSLTNNVIKSINGMTDFLGRTVSWLTVVMVATLLIVVVTRYFLQIGSIALQESVTYLHATVFLLGIAYTLKQGGHVRVDIFYRQFSPRRKALVNFCGGIFFLIPVSVLIFYSSWDYVMASWAIGETSAENNGLPFIYLLKTLMILMPATLLLQGVAEILKSLLVLINQSNTGESSDILTSSDVQESTV